MTGTGVERDELATNMSEAWVAFARSGDPNYRGMPRWNPWNPTEWSTMVFNREIAAMNDPWATSAALWKESGIGNQDSRPDS